MKVFFLKLNFLRLWISMKDQNLQMHSKMFITMKEKQLFEKETKEMCSISSKRDTQLQQKLLRPEKPQSKSWIMNQVIILENEL